MKALKRRSRCVCASPVINVAELSTSNRAKLPVVRLEPLLIGGLYPKNLEDRILINIDQVPPFLLETLVTVEDLIFTITWGCPRNRSPVLSGSTRLPGKCARVAVR